MAEVNNETQQNPNEPTTEELSLTERLDKRLDSILAYIEGVDALLDSYILELQNELENAKNGATDKFYAKKAEAEKKIEEKLKTVQKKLTSWLKGVFKKAKEKIEPVEPLLNVNLSIDTVVDVVKSIIEIITAPYEPTIEVIKWITTSAIPKIQECNEKISGITDRRLECDDPNIDTSLNISVPPINPSDIIS